MLAAYRDGRLAHAWLIGGPEGVGKATLAWRFARFVLANPDPAAPIRARDARPRGRRGSSGRAADRRARASGFRSDAARMADVKSKGFITEIRVEDVRARAADVSDVGRLRRLADRHRRLRRGSESQQRQRAAEDDRGAARRALILIVAHRPGQVLPTIRSRCRRLMLDPLTAAKSTQTIGGLGRPGATSIRPQRRTPPAARRRFGRARRLRRLVPDGQELGALIDAAIARSAATRAPHDVPGSPTRSPDAAPRRPSRR